jgi:hypothetical protein
MQTDLNQSMGELVQQLPRISDVASAKVGELSGALVGLASGPKWPQVFLPRPLASYVCICHHFGQSSCIEIYFHVQVELGEL